MTIGTSGSTVAFPSVGGFSGLIQLPPADSAGTLQIVASTFVPYGMTSVQTKRRNTDPVNETTYLFITLTAQSNIHMLGTFTVSVNLPATVSPAQTFYLAAMASDGSWQTITPSGTVNGQNVQVGLPAEITISSGATLPLAFYSGVVVNSGPPISAYPAKLDFASPGQTQSLTVSGYKSTQTFSADASGCSGIVTASMTPPSKVNVTSLGQGSCVVHVRDQFGHTLDIPTTVSSTTVVIL